jgi:glycosyltransferase involved in cell wall biosynthesis
MKINFVMMGTKKSGGTRHLFILANGLAEKGHEVTIISLGPKEHIWFNFDKRVKFIFPEKSFFFPGVGMKSVSSIFNGILRKISKNYEIDRIKLLAKNIPNADVSIATYYPTAYSVFLSGKGKMCYYVQHYEKIFSKDSFDSSLAEGSYYLPLRKFAVSDWLVKLMQLKSNSKVSYTGAGVDLDVFKPSNKKDEKTILGMFREDEWKGGKELFEAFNIIRKKDPEVKFKVIGNPITIKKRLKELGLTIECEIFYGKNGEMLDDKSVSKLFSESSLFLFTSHLEGFGSPPLEAMACGTPSVVTNCEGIRDFARNEVNSLIVPIKNSKKVAEAALRLLEDKELYKKIRKEGLITSRKFTWDIMLNNLILGLTEKEKMIKNFVI